MKSKYMVSTLKYFNDLGINSTFASEHGRETLMMHESSLELSVEETPGKNSQNSKIFYPNIAQISQDSNFTVSAANRFHARYPINVDFQNSSFNFKENVNNIISGLLNFNILPNANRETYLENAECETISNRSGKLLSTSNVLADNVLVLCESRLEDLAGMFKEHSDRHVYKLHIAGEVRYGVGENRIDPINIFCSHILNFMNFVTKSTYYVFFKKGPSDSLNVSNHKIQVLFNSMTTLIKGTTSFKQDILHSINLSTLNVDLNTLYNFDNVRSAPSLISTYCAYGIGGVYDMFTLNQYSPILAYRQKQTVMAFKNAVLSIASKFTTGGAAESVETIVCYESF